MSIETLDYTIVFNEHTVTCFEVGSMPTIGYASIEDAMTGTNPVIVPECIFEAVCALLDQGVRLTAIYAHVGEETWMQWDEVPEELTAEDIVAIEGENSIRKQTVNRKQRRSARRVQNARHKVSDRKHGKHAHDVRKAIWENTADWDDMPNNTYFRWDEKRKTFMSPKKPKVHRVKRTFRDRQKAAFRDRLTDITPIERLTASVLAEVKQYHGMVGCTWNVFYLTEAICQREQLPYPDDVYVCEFGEKVELVLGYFDSYEDEDYSTHKYIDLRA